MNDGTTAMINEFKTEAEEMFQNAQTSLLKLNQGESFEEHYNKIYRAFVSLKGAAGLFDFLDLKNHMLNMETLFESLKSESKINKLQINYLLNGIDAAKKILANEKASFTYLTVSEYHKENFALPKESTLELLALNSSQAEYKNGILYIVDDEPGIAEILTEVIQSHGFTVKCFYNGKDALKNIENDNPDAVLIDVNMPGISGLEFIKICNTEKYELPIILISGMLTKEVRTEGIKAGAFAFISKPFDGEKDIATCISAVKQNKTMRLLNKSINYIMYQFNDLDQFLKQQGKESMRIMLKNELQSMLELKMDLKTFQVVHK